MDLRRDIVFLRLLAAMDGRGGGGVALFLSSCLSTLSKFSAAPGDSFKDRRRPPFRFALLAEDALEMDEEDEAEDESESPESLSSDLLFFFFFFLSFLSFLSFLLFFFFSLSDF